MDSWDTANLVLGCFCIVLSFLPTGYLISNNRYKRKLYLYSLLICVANIGMALGSLPEYLMDAVVEAGERRVLLLGGTLYYGAFTCLLFFFLQYFFEYLHASGTGKPALPTYPALPVPRPQMAWARAGLPQSPRWSHPVRVPRRKSPEFLTGRWPVPRLPH